jgi:hypothetical protein
MAFINAAIADSSAPYRDVKSVQFGILSPDEIVNRILIYFFNFGYIIILIDVISVECQ